MNARNRILSAFAELVFEAHYDEITVGRIVSRAGVARSTFYAHFQGRQALLVAAVRPLLDVVRAVAAGRADAPGTRDMLEHVWENRSTAHRLLHPSVRQHLAVAACPHGNALLALRVHGVLGLLYDWADGRIDADAGTLADILNGEFAGRV